MRRLGFRRLDRAFVLCPCVQTPRMIHESDIARIQGVRGLQISRPKSISAWL